MLLASRHAQRTTSHGSTRLSGGRSRPVLLPPVIGEDAVLQLVEKGQNKRNRLNSKQLYSLRNNKESRPPPKQDRLQKQGMETRAICSALTSLPHHGETAGSCTMYGYSCTLYVLRTEYKVHRTGLTNTASAAIEINGWCSSSVKMTQRRCCGTALCIAAHMAPHGIAPERSCHSMQ